VLKFLHELPLTIVPVSVLLRWNGASTSRLSQRTLAGCSGSRDSNEVETFRYVRAMLFATGPISSRVIPMLQWVDCDRWTARICPNGESQCR
jgi:hypothetical protein